MYKYVILLFGILLCILLICYQNMNKDVNKNMNQDVKKTMYKDEVFNSDGSKTHYPKKHE